jgi:DNA polymerase-3 subunit alpha
MAHSGFVPLRVFSCYTMLEGAIEPKAIAKRARESWVFPPSPVRSQRALCGDVLSEACDEGGRPADRRHLARGQAPDMPDGVTAPIDWLALYAQDAAGYENLCALVSMAHLDRPIEEDAHVPFEALRGRTDGLIA